jgi:predicted RNA-binding protein with PUA-like domain
MNYWLMKSEPTAFSIDDLKDMPKQTEHWDGVRNYQARNMMRDQMKVGDQVFFYHSNCKVPGIVGIMEVVRESYPDHTAYEPQSKYFDPKSSPEKPRWFMVDIKYIRHTRRVIPLTELKDCEPLENMQLVRKGNRLSILPVSAAEWKIILRLERVASS